LARAFQVTRFQVECPSNERFVKARRVNPKDFFAELKRRNVYKVAIAYAVIAWLLMQIATQVFPFLEIPNWAIRLVIMLLALGFPIALVIAWAFELTPEGLKRTEAADESPKKSAPSRVWIYVIVVAGATSVSLFFLGRYTASNKQGGRVELPGKSLAVLPFANLSGNPENAYFAVGIQDEIITRLARIAELKVISCTSTERFKSSVDDVPAIAGQLGVANVLEGSVQRTGDKVRVNVQLIKGATDTRLWADTFDRNLTDIFEVESEIAKTVAESLQAKLSGSEQHAIAARPTENPEAHEFYLKGRYYWEKRTGQNLKKAIDQFQQAADKDPNYALAYVGLADCYLLLEDYVGAPASETCPKAEAFAKRAPASGAPAAVFCAHAAVVSTRGASSPAAAALSSRCTSITGRNIHRHSFQVTIAPSRMRVFASLSCLGDSSVGIVTPFWLRFSSPSGIP
jgi:TolB-like protein